MKQLTVNIKLVQGDITEQNVDCIVNAANKELRGGKGVCGAIYKAAGRDELQAETTPLGPISTGSAVMSSAQNLTTYGLVGDKHGIKGIVHAVGPIYQDGLHGEVELLASAYRNSLILARQYGYKSIAFPCISTGVYGFPAALAAKIAVTTVVEYLLQNPGLTVVFVAFESDDFILLETALHNTKQYGQLFVDTGKLSAFNIDCEQKQSLDKMLYDAGLQPLQNQQTDFQFKKAITDITDPFSDI